VDMFFITLAEMIVSPISQSIANMLTDPKARDRYSCFGFRDYLWRLLSLVIRRQAYNPNPSTLTVPLGF